MNTAKGLETARPWRGLFGLHLDYAQALAARSSLSLADALTYHTNLHRLFGFGHLAKSEPATGFASMLERLLSLPCRNEQIDLLVDAFALRPFVWPFPGAETPPDRRQFGCFACEPPAPDGVVRIHFGPRDIGGGVGPLHSSKQDARRTEMAALTQFIAAAYPDATGVMGGSWLYNLEAYRRIFPPEFAASRAPLVGPRSTHGFSSWGQFVSFRGELKPETANAFHRNLETLDPHQPWLAFPLPVLITRAPLATFMRHYGV